MTIWYKRIIESFYGFWRCNYLTDVKMICGGNEVVFGHKLILASISGTFKRLLLDLDHEGEDATIYLPDFSKQDLTAFLEAVYSGHLEVVDLREISSLCRFFGVFNGKKNEDEERRRKFYYQTAEAEIKRNNDKRHESWPCSICDKRASEHKITLEDEEDQQQVQYVFKCCLKSCEDKVQKTAKVFNKHMAKHDPNSVSVSTSTKSCPLCLRPRFAHKNTDSDGGSKKARHKTGSIFKCCKCSASKLSAKRFFDHVENHLSKKYKCSDCSKGFSYEHLLTEHKHKEHSGDYRPLKCERCDFETLHKQTLTSHIKEKHEGIQRDHKALDANLTVVCPNCKKELKKWYFQRHHQKSCSLSSRKSQHFCEECDVGFVSEITLRNHRIAKHSQERPFECEYCPLKYATSMALSAHRSRKHNVNKAGDFVPKKMFPCPQCGNLLTSNTKLKAHIRVVHNNEKAFKCGYCDKTFASRSNMQVHEGSAHTGILPYKCAECDKSFPRKNQLEAHLEKTHVNPAAAAAEQPAFVGEDKGNFLVVESNNEPNLGVSDIILT